MASLDDFFGFLSSISVSQERREEWKKLLEGLEYEDLFSISEETLREDMKGASAAKIKTFLGHLENFKQEHLVPQSPLHESFQEPTLVEPAASQAMASSSSLPSHEASTANSSSQPDPEPIIIYIPHQAPDDYLKAMNREDIFNQFFSERFFIYGQYAPSPTNFHISFPFDLPSREVALMKSREICMKVASFYANYYMVKVPKNVVMKTMTTLIEDYPVLEELNRKSLLNSIFYFFNKEVDIMSFAGYQAGTWDWPSRKREEYMTRYLEEKEERMAKRKKKHDVDQVLERQKQILLGDGSSAQVTNLTDRDSKEEIKAYLNQIKDGKKFFDVLVLQLEEKYGEEGVEYKSSTALTFKNRCLDLYLKLEKEGELNLVTSLNSDPFIEDRMVFSSILFIQKHFESETPFFAGMEYSADHPFLAMDNKRRSLEWFLRKKKPTGVIQYKGLKVMKATGFEAILIVFFFYYLFSIKTDAYVAFKRMFQFVQHFLLDYPTDGSLDPEVKRLGEKYFN